MSTIPLAKSFNEKKLQFPVYLSHKIDGVPVRIDIDHDGNHTIRTRQDKDVPAVRRLVQSFVDSYIQEDYELDCVTPISFVGEVYQRGNPYADFKDTSGIVRRQYDQSDQLSIALFECSAPGNFEERYQFMRDYVVDSQVYPVQQVRVDDLESLYAHFREFQALFPDAEGMVARSECDEWKPGKRSWGYQKLLAEPTIDLRIVGVEEAIDQYGNPKGMAGGLIASYHGEHIGVGPGRLTHAERIKLWKDFNEASCKIGGWHGPIAQIKYKKDASYSALRQATFQYWRPEKDSADA